MGKYLIPIISLVVLIGGEFYLWKAVQLLLSDRFKSVKWIYIAINLLLYFFVFSYRSIGVKYFSKTIGTSIAGMFLILLLTKLIVFLFLFAGDLIQLVSFGAKKIKATDTTDSPIISRSAFLAKLALGVAAIPAFSLIYGVVVNAYNYQFRKITLKFPNLPKAFDGFRVVQLSDIHSGSFTKTEPIIEAVKKINELGADLILFTGDLVNDRAEEMLPYKAIFSQLKAKHGVLSVTGNHDYGDYVPWDTEAEKVANFNAFMATHKEMGWDLLMNEHRVIEKEGEKIAVLGIENWGKALRFPKYGKMSEAHRGTEDIPFKILMSHDPSHWDAQVRTEYSDIDLTLSGHTHGFQFGIENKLFKWSPSQWVYKQWAGLYKEAKQYIYVNRGFGFLGYPGRVGILPEVTIIELKTA